MWPKMSLLFREERLYDGEVKLGVRTLCSNRTALRKASALRSATREPSQDRDGPYG